MLALVYHRSVIRYLLGKGLSRFWPRTFFAGVAPLRLQEIDFSPPGGRIAITLDGDGERARVRVRDQGPGIPDYAMPRLFERFYSTPRPDTGKRGSGLGLNLVQEVARLHRGALDLRNHPEGGAEASLSLPTGGPASAA